MLCKVEYLPGIFVRRLAECFAVILYPIATMLLVNGHCEQSNLIPIVLNQSRPKGLTITPDEAVRLLMWRHKSNSRRGAGAQCRSNFGSFVFSHARVLPLT
jgi:hypothetical protein